MATVLKKFYTHFYHFIFSKRRKKICQAHFSPFFVAILEKHKK